MDNAKWQHFTSLEEALKSFFGNGAEIRKREFVGGGDINEAYKLTLADGTHLFMKVNVGKPEAFFDAEAAGLSAIAQTGTIGTPHIFCVGTQKEGSFLLLEFLEQGRRISDYWEVFGRQLAAMHRADTEGFVKNGVYGFLQDNFIGESSQINTAHQSWISFFRDCRLGPQLRRADAYFDREDRKKAEKLLERLEDILVEPEYPSLLHGDLWGGNFMTGSDGKAWLIDPAVYVGCAEADIAMTELFGGFSRAFYDAYYEAAPMQAGYEYRKDLYNLYHLLNHLNLFGASYLSSAKRIIGRYIP